MNDEEFKELFWSLWKYDKSEINQDNWLGLCYAYTWFEILKKSNFFKELIQTNFKKVWEWKWEVRIPFCNPNWYWMKVNINEIFDENWKDRKYSFIPFFEIFFISLFDSIYSSSTKLKWHFNILGYNILEFDNIFLILLNDNVLA